MRIARGRFLAGHYPFFETLHSLAFSSRNSSFSAMDDRVRVLHLKDVPILLRFPLSPVLSGGSRQPEYRNVSVDPRRLPPDADEDALEPKQGGTFYAIR